MIPARLLLSLASSVLSEHLPNTHNGLPAPDAPNNISPSPTLHVFEKRGSEKHDGKFIAFVILIPVLVILSGIFAGLTLGYMSLDETQLNVLSVSGSPKQREYANKIKPIRKNGHLLLVTLLLANMIVNETLPVISDPVLGGGLPSVVVSTVLIVLFAEIIPQSVCTRYGLYIGAKMAIPTQILIYILGIIAWPVAKLLEFILGSHHGIIYRKAELKELIAMHDAQSPHGGDLRTDTVTIIGATLDLQDKTVRHAMTPISRVFMLSVDARLDYETLRRVCLTGHSRIPVYEEVEVNLPAAFVDAAISDNLIERSAVISPPPAPRKGFMGTVMGQEPKDVRVRVKKIIGILLVKQCVLLDPEDAVPVRKMRLNKVHFVPQNEPLLGILDRFQEGRSHLAIISRISVEKAHSVKKAVKKGLTRRLLGAVRGDSSSSGASSEESGDEDDEGRTVVDSENTNKDRAGQSSEDADNSGDVDGTKDSDVEDGHKKKPSKRGRGRKRKHRKRNKEEDEDLEKGKPEQEKTKRAALEQSMPADAVLSYENALEYLQNQGIDPAIMPLGIITLEDVLEELIGEEIYDEFDVEGTGAHSESFVPPGAAPLQTQHLARKNSAPELAYTDEKITDSGLARAGSVTPPVPSPTPGRSLGLAMPKPIALQSLKSLGFLRSRSAPPVPRDTNRATSQPSNSGSATRNSSTPAPVEGDVNVATPETSPNLRDLSAVPGPVITPVIQEFESKGLAQINENQSPTESTLEVETKPSNIDTADGNIGSPTPVSPIPPRAMSVAPHLAHVPGASPRSTSPAPALEAFLLDRRRRAQAQSSGVVTSSSPSVGAASVPVAASPSIGQTVSTVGLSVQGRVEGIPTKTKGGFKSSPLSGNPSGSNVVVAEEIKKQQIVEKSGSKDDTNPTNTPSGNSTE